MILMNLFVTYSELTRVSWWCPAPNTNSTALVDLQYKTPTFSRLPVGLRPEWSGEKDRNVSLPLLEERSGASLSLSSRSRSLSESLISPSGATMTGNAKVSRMETRQSHCNAPDKNAAVAGGNISNKVTKARYTLVTFLHMNLTSQSRRLANVYFLVISCLQLFTPLSPTSRYSTAAPFAFVLLLNMIRELFEDSEPKSLPSAEFSILSRPTTGSTPLAARSYVRSRRTF
jgi:hypothetical protein